jgi:hypothetical protein
MLNIRQIAEAAAGKRNAEPAGRASVRVSEKENGLMPVGYWKPEWDGYAAESWVGQLRQAFGGAMRIAQRHVEAREAAQMAKIKGEPDPSLTLDQERTALDRELSALDQMKQSVAALQADLVARREALQPVDIDKTDAAAAMVRAQTREYLKTALPSMKADDRMKFLNAADDMTAAAILEAPAVLSGLGDAQKANFREARIKARFPEQVAGIDEGLEAAKLTARAINAAWASASNRMLPLLDVPPAPPPGGRPWA